MAAAAVVTASDTIASNDNDTTVPTSAAVKDYADSKFSSATATSASSLTPEGQHARYITTLTALAANLTINAPSGTAVEGNMIAIEVIATGGTRTLTLNAAYTNPYGYTIPASLASGKRCKLLYRYNSVSAKWELWAVNNT